MKPFRAPLFVMCLLSLAPPLTHSAEESATDTATPASAELETARSLPAIVETVLSGGYWQNEKAPKGEGTFRLVILARGFDDIRRELYLQWITQPPGPENTPEILHTTPLREIDPDWVITSQNYELIENAWRLTLVAERKKPQSDANSSSPGHQTKTFKILPAPDFTYQVEAD